MSRERPAWWPPEFSPELLGAFLMGKSYEDAMYLSFAADCEVLFRQLNRESPPPKPDNFNPLRVQLWVVNSRVTHYEVG